MFRASQSLLGWRAHLPLSLKLANKWIKRPIPTPPSLLPNQSLFLDFFFFNSFIYLFPFVILYFIFFIHSGILVRTLSLLFSLFTAYRHNRSPTHLTRASPSPHVSLLSLVQQIESRERNLTHRPRSNIIYIYIYIYVSQSRERLC